MRRQIRGTKSCGKSTFLFRSYKNFNSWSFEFHFHDNSSVIIIDAFHIIFYCKAIFHFKSSVLTI